ncbi:hypothetical protein BDP55DRAFT_751283 [Colletotrichum godetiae]|uniref:Uncharacterized protein n=1 Tax=Colletotrichum godetiae TaxID=1209918 RepID=A0AAJ0AYR7_9PEZI|nr:uncharacterized protein BDP55DRAFT_751283 [Colletotrichum godetiae]KAK1691486.1 hypothetical protein BDP55DRAFT_751283 [Colletotrichum godetiae]
MEGKGRVRYGSQMGWFMPHGSGREQYTTLEWGQRPDLGRQHCASLCKNATHATPSFLKLQASRCQLHVASLEPEHPPNSPAKYAISVHESLCIRRLVEFAFVFGMGEDNGCIVGQSWQGKPTLELGRGPGLGLEKTATSYPTSPDRPATLADLSAFGQDGKVHVDRCRPPARPDITRLSGNCRPSPSPTRICTEYLLRRGEAVEVMEITVRGPGLELKSGKRRGRKQGLNRKLLRWVECHDTICKAPP